MKKRFFNFSMKNLKKEKKKSSAKKVEKFQLFSNVYTYNDT